MRRAIRNPICVAAASALVLIGCGNDGDGSESGSTTDKQEFIAAADEVCAEGDAELDAQGREFTLANPRDLEGLVGTVIVPGLREQLEQLRELDPPEEDRAQIEEFVDTLERGVDQLEANPDQLLTGRAARTILDARKQAEAYGMVGCARGAGAA